MQDCSFIYSYRHMKFKLLSFFLIYNFCDNLMEPQNSPGGFFVSPHAPYALQLICHSYFFAFGF